MKKTIFTIALAVISIFTLSAKSDSKSKASTSSTAFHTIVIQDAVNVVLSETVTSQVQNIQDVHNLNWKVKNGVLYISKQRRSESINVVNISVQNLKKIILYDGAQVNAAGLQTSDKLIVRLNGNSSASITSSGKIELINGEDVQLSVYKKLGDVYTGM